MPARARGFGGAGPEPNLPCLNGRSSSFLSAPKVPGTESVWIRTYGCAHNTSDSEYMAGQLQAYGYRLVRWQRTLPLPPRQSGKSKSFPLLAMRSSPPPLYRPPTSARPLGHASQVDDAASADLWLVNTCTVKNPSQSAMDSDIRRARDTGKKIVVAGCVPQGDKNASALQGLSVVGERKLTPRKSCLVVLLSPRPVCPGPIAPPLPATGTSQIDRIVEAVEETLKGNAVHMLQKKALPRLDLPKVRRNPHIEIIPLSTGASAGRLVPACAQPQTDAAEMLGSARKTRG